MDTLYQVLDAARNTILTDKHLLYYESAVRQRIIDPILEALGWNSSNLDLVREQKVKVCADKEISKEQLDNDTDIEKVSLLNLFSEEESFETDPAEEEESGGRKPKGGARRPPLLDYVLFERLPWGRIPRVYIEVKSLAPEINYGLINPLHNHLESSDKNEKASLIEAIKDKPWPYVSSLLNLLDNKPPCGGIESIDLGRAFWPSIIVLTNGDSWFISHFDQDSKDYFIEHVFSFTSDTLHEIAHRLLSTISPQAVKGIYDVPLTIDRDIYYSVRASLREFSSSKRGRGSTVKAIIWPSPQMLHGRHLIKFLIRIGTWADIADKISSVIQAMYRGVYFIPPISKSRLPSSGIHSINNLYDYLVKIWTCYPEIGINPDTVLLSWVK